MPQSPPIHPAHPQYRREFDWFGGDEDYRPGLTMSTPPGWERPKISDTVLDHIGCTPLIRINSIGAGLKCELLGKCEFMNAGGSVKDRIGKRMVEEAEKSGRIKPGDTLIEPTSGNTGVGLAMAGAVKGYKVVITLPEKMSNEKVNMLKGLGASIVRTPTEAAWDAPESHIGVAARLHHELPNSHILDQYKNPANPDAHYEGTAREILHQCDGRLDMVVVGAGTGGTITGIARRLKEVLPNLIVVGVDPVGSILAQPESLNTPGPSYLVEGIGYDFVPEVLDRGLVDKWVKSNDADSLRMARRIIREEGLMVGGSSGAAMAAALQAARSLGAGQRCVVLLPDSTRNYMTKFLDDEWMVDMGLEPASILTKGSSGLGALGAAADAGTGRAPEWWERRHVVELELPTPLTVAPTMCCADAVALMEEHGFDQLPVVDDVRGVVGVVALGHVSARILAGRATPREPVEALMFTRFKQVPLQTPLSVLAHIFKRDSFCCVVATQRSCVGGAALGSPRLLREKKVVVGVCSHVDLLKFVLGSSPQPPQPPDPRTAATPSHTPSTPPLLAAACRPGGFMAVANDPRHMGCQEYIWKAIKHAKTPEASPVLGATPAAKWDVPPLDPRHMGCQQYIWSAIQHAKTPEPSPALSAASTAMAVPPLSGAEALPPSMAKSQPHDGHCPSYIWSFVKNKTPLGSPLGSPAASLRSTPMTSPMTSPVTSPAVAPTGGDHLTMPLLPRAYTSM